MSKRLNAIHPNAKSLQTYLWITSSQQCWETRGLKKKDTNLIVKDNYSKSDMKNRNFSRFLNNWESIIGKIK